MSRGLGKLQRALLIELEKHDKWTTAIELAMATQPGGPEPDPVFDRTHLVSVRRALHGLSRLGKVTLFHGRLSYYDSRIYGRALLVQAEVLCAYLPSRKTVLGIDDRPQTLNPKRCVPVTNTRTQHLLGVAAE